MINHQPPRWPPTADQAKSATPATISQQTLLMEKVKKKKNHTNAFLKYWFKFRPNNIDNPAQLIATVTLMATHCLKWHQNVFSTITDIESTNTALTKWFTVIILIILKYWFICFQIDFQRWFIDRPINKNTQIKWNMLLVSFPIISPKPQQSEWIMAFPFLCSKCKTCVTHCV